MGLPSDFPKRSGAARNAYILGAIDDGRIVPIWHPLTVTAGGHTATFYVLEDALKLNGVRLSTTANNLQQIADKLRASLMTPRLIDLAFLHADVVIPPQTIYPPDDTTAALEKESAKMDAAIDGRAGLVAPIGKPWCLSNVLIGAKARDGSIAAALYGWAVANGFTPPAGVDLHKGTLPGIQNIQPLSTVHSAAGYSDYAMLASIVRRDVVLDGQAVDLWAVMQSRDPSVSSLVSHEGPLRVLRQPGVPVLPPIGPANLGGLVAMASGLSPGFFAMNAGAYSSLDQAEEAKVILRDQLRGARWVRGIGITNTRDEDGYAIKVNVSRESDRLLLPKQVLGVTVYSMAVGQITPQMGVDVGPWGHSASGKPLPVGTRVQIRQHEQHVLRRRRYEQEHPAKAGLQDTFWHFVAIPVTTVAGIIVGKLIEIHYRKKSGTT